ncbi:MAG: N-acetylglucosamine-6-phosphate deacetylase [Chloroflexota bacterium]|nr:N-acetylglucosamine-6-phosphate deacetylase [Chloroflexota bacterium]
MIALVGRVLAPEDLGLCLVTIEDGWIHDIGSAEEASEDAIGGPDSWILPGLVDLQLNGAFGVDFSDPHGDLAAAALALPSTGVTAFLPTIVSGPPNRYLPCLANLGATMPEGAARVLGVHLEGPYLAPARGGTHHPAAIRDPDLGELCSWLDTGTVRMVTLAPELPGAAALIEELVRRGVIAAIGHSDAGWEVADAAVRAGARLGTHLFNAMHPFHHRDPGIAGRLLANGVAVSVIVDGVHLAPETVKMVASAKHPDELVLITDGLAALGEPPGRYRLGNREVVSDGTAARLDDGTLSGSVLPMATALGRLVDAGLDPSTVARGASTNPARLLGAGEELGRLAPGRPADLVLLDRHWTPLMTFVGGRVAHGGPH